MVTVNSSNKAYFITRVIHDGNHTVQVRQSPAITVTQKSASCVLAGFSSGKRRWYRNQRSKRIQLKFPPNSSISIMSEVWWQGAGRGIILFLKILIMNVASSSPLCFRTGMSQYRSGWSSQRSNCRELNYDKAYLKVTLDPANVCPRMLFPFAKSGRTCIDCSSSITGDISLT